MQNQNLEHYLEFLKEFADLHRPVRAVVDCSNGPAGMIVENLKIDNLEIVVINKEPDGNFPAHGPDPTKPGALEDAKKKVIEVGADFGVALDSDGDRAVFVDNKGRGLPFYVAAQLLFSAHKPPFVADLLVYESLKYLNYENIEDVVASKVGTRFIKESMKRTSAPVGAEFSGHYFFEAKTEGTKFYIDSALMATIKMANVLSALEVSLAEFYDALPEFYYDLITIPKSGGSEIVVDKIKNEFDGNPTESNLDGTMLEFADWWVNVRDSNTEPIRKITVGSRNKDKLGAVKNLFS